MKNSLYISLLLLPVLALGQTATVNYVKTSVYKWPTTISNDNKSLSTVTYFDGLGRPIQKIVQTAGEYSDFVTHIEYDQYNRQSKEYLPYKSLSENSLAFDPNAKANTTLLYNTAKYENTLNPYSEQFFEPSPLNRVLKQAAPGTLWEGAIDVYATNDRTVKFSYYTNIVGEVRKFSVVFPNGANTEKPDLASTGFYSANQLIKTITKDENWVSADGKYKTTEGFKDNLGRLILKRTYAKTSVGTMDTYDTYYVYDRYGNLTYVIPPLAADKVVLNNIIQIEALNLCYIYHYDLRNRVVQKHIPDNGWTIMNYDYRNRLVYSQDENQRVNRVDSSTNRPYNLSSFIVYDKFNRAVYTGIVGASSSGSDLDNPSFMRSTFNADRSTSFTNNGLPINYTNVNPSTALDYDVHTVNYYDDYNFNTNGIVIPTATEVTLIPYDRKLKGLSTGTMVRILDTPTPYWSASILQYDAKGRVIWKQNKNSFLNTTTTESLSLDFSGQVTSSSKKHIKGSVTTQVNDTFTYDWHGKLVSHLQSINGSGGNILFYNKYDELGKLSEKKVGAARSFIPDFYGDIKNPLQTIDYTYNIRGWLTGVNKAPIYGRGLYTFNINYTGLYNGNISSTSWKTIKDTQEKKYTYTYDPLNRLNDAVYSNPAVTAEKFHEQGINYDKNGNILQLQRWDTGGMIDQLAYTYKDNSNQLMRVTDSQSNIKGFNNGISGTGNDYEYDLNGNLQKDLNKDIGKTPENEIAYNHLNLPVFLAKDATHKIEYVYDATGVKLQKKVTNGTAITTTQYAGAYVYENNVMQYIANSDGYARRETNGNFTYVYQYKDHLGNVRLSYADKNGDGIITDGDRFEDGFESQSGWAANKKWNTGTVIYDGVAVKTGKYMGKIINPGPGEVYCHSDYWMPVNNSQSTNYTYSAWVYSSGPSIQLFLHMKTETEAGYATLADNVLTTVVGQWIKIEKTFSVPANIRSLNLRLDNNGAGVVWFDDVQIRRTSVIDSEIIEEDSYYPFGMKHVIAGNAVLSTNIGQKNKYNGKELQDELGLNLYDYGARNYDPIIGRWFNTDPKAESYSNVSPYVYALNNPTFFIDPNGKEIKNGDEFASKYYQKRASNELHRMSVYETQYGTDKSGYADKGIYKTYKNIKDNQNKFKKLAEGHAGKVGLAASRMKEFESGAPELFSLMNNIQDASGREIDIYLHVSNIFTAGGFGNTEYTYTDSKDSSGNRLVTIGPNSIYGNHVSVTVSQTPTNDGTLDNAPSTLRITKHEMGHAFHVITQSKGYLEYLEDLNMTHSKTNGGHYPVSNPSGKTAEEWEKK